jgi:hypothetical protein
MADGSLDSKVGARICNGLGIMRACLETQKLEQLEAHMDEIADRVARDSHPPAAASNPPRPPVSRPVQPGSSFWASRASAPNGRPNPFVDTMPSSPILQAWAKTVGPFALDMLVEPNAGAGLGQDGCECNLADLKRITPLNSIRSNAYRNTLSLAR